jgi:hypothetical protein
VGAGNLVLEAVSAGTPIRAHPLPRFLVAAVYEQSQQPIIVYRADGSAELVTTALARASETPAD